MSFKKIGTERKQRVLGCPICGSFPDLFGDREDRDEDAAQKVYLECCRCHFRTPIITTEDVSDQLITGFRRPVDAAVGVWNARSYYGERFCGGYGGHPWW